MSNEVTHTVTSTVHKHPWYEEDKTYVTQVWEFNSFNLTKAVINKAIYEGWSIWLVSNVGNPAIVVYKKVTE